LDSLYSCKNALGSSGKSAMVDVFDFCTDPLALAATLALKLTLFLAA